ncbi:ABC transporter substrate-binding protein [Brevibacillus ruminantium]|uniref:ABC transporter substrate-binding protein n=1 Tax=Brevibacillus ruminantium TaxID=2950604 RepID=A0ABY4WB27_9BACL|nr:ABC transporter substrate-binding protein [Brevibacillus ruminantium]USG63353.1 ABC transporter substrate-binding protein [Brevibacillus ruminantium]
MKRFKFLLLSLLTAVSLAGCGGVGNTNQNSQAPVTDELSGGASATQPADKSEKATTYPITIKDATGQDITFTQAPEKIVSASPAETEILFALGLGDKVVGVSDYDDYPEEAKTKPKVGGVLSPNEEAILSQSPDLVIGGISMKKEVVAKLRSLDLKVVTVRPKVVQDVMEDILLIGQITDRQVQAEELVSRMKEDIRKVTEAVQSLKPEEKKKVYLEFSAGWTVGKGEFLDELINLAGGINIAADTEGWNPISEEKILKEDPDVILYAKGFTDEKTGETLEQTIRKRNGWDKMKAIRENQVAGLDHNVLSRPGPRITEGLYEMAKAIYPDRLK